LTCCTVNLKYTTEDLPTLMAEVLVDLSSLDNTCILCLEDFDVAKTHTTRCGHTFHAYCLNRLCTITDPSCVQCPKCESPMLYHSSTDKDDIVRTIRKLLIKVDIERHSIYKIPYTLELVQYLADLADHLHKLEVKNFARTVENKFDEFLNDEESYSNFIKYDQTYNTNSIQTILACKQKLEAFFEWGRTNP